ncbi:MAG TPA: tetratricopeptide repeat protein [Steroidobacteraceae bacterium]|nr:tetratricopeptide repeat protein [Steroidobacteraceae bacterium]
MPAFVAVLAWGAAIFGSFQYDDFPNILDDPATHRFDALLGRLATGIRPLTRLSYAISDRIVGEWAGGWLLINVLLHVFTVAGLAKLVQLRTRDAMAAALAGICFALQPANAAVIAYASGRSTGLAVAFIVGAMILHERSVDASKRSHGIAWSMMLFLCACASKEVAIVLPALMLLWERTRPVPTTWRVTLRRVVPYAIASIAAAILMLVLSPRYRELLAFSLSMRSPLDAMLHNLIALPMSLSLWFTPWLLSVEHPATYSTPALILGFTIIAGMIVLARRERTGRPFITLALMWPIIAMLPTHSFIAKSDAISEGPLYLAWIGPSLALGHWFARRARESQLFQFKRTAIVLSALAIGLCQWRVSVWQDSISLWQEATLRAPTSARAWTNLGVAQLAQGHNDSARDALQMALKLDPGSMQARSNLDILAALAASARSTNEK